MIFMNSLDSPPPPPPPGPPSSPYEVERIPVGTIGREQAMKVYPNGLKDNMTDEEAGVWGRVVWLRDTLAAGAAPIGEPPALPYDVQTFKYGATGVEHPTKVYRLGGGAILTDDERKAWAYLEHLAGEVAKLPPAVEPTVAVPEPQPEQPEQATEVSPAGQEEQPAAEKPAGAWRKWA